MLLLKKYKKIRIHFSLWKGFCQNFSKIANLTKQTFIGSVANFTPNSIIINCKNFEELVSNDWNLAAFGQEIIKFKKWKKRKRLVKAV